MTIKSAPYYWVECDLCEASATEGSDHSAWSEPDHATSDAENAGWTVGGENGAPERVGHVCDDCAPRWTCPDCGEYRTTLDGPCPNRECGWTPELAEGPDVGGESI